MGDMGDTATQQKNDLPLHKLSPPPTQHLPPPSKNILQTQLLLVGVASIVWTRAGLHHGVLRT